MTEADAKRAGVDRTHGRSLVQKTVFWAGHLGLVAVCAWFAFFDGTRVVFGWTLPDPQRARMLLACAALYWVRHGITLFYLLQRRVDWAEVMGLLPFFGLIEIGLLLVGGGAFREGPLALGWLDGVALVLVLAGSCLNSCSEIQRKRWKGDQANKGHCHTGGLFKYAMHINYFGDTVMFTGWSLFSGNPWTLSLPVLMAAMFVFYHIPGLDAYLAERYGEEFAVYAARTKKFIPFIY